ncbi:Trp biosynthesis-associated membrane protein [Planctomonas psychrotolerans]|uniref:Trp biosynthesis-associated membrane protein n=1 Tax=Planctomonas psychrotolerans TaxID=2528712 RepID=UPI001D0D80B5|nr:Trp biosynthesis-associated membrane protein [Planctomonas psychrotolerans]
MTDRTAPDSTGSDGRAPDGRTTHGRRLKSLAILAGLALGALVLLAWSQQWFTLTLVGDVPTEIGVPGAVAAPALSALALASLALAAALSIAGIVFRVILGALQILLGACVALSAVLAIADPISAGARTVTDTTGVDGQASIAALVTASAATAWPGVTLALGVLLALQGVGILATARRWPAGSRRYAAASTESPLRFAPVDDDSAPRDRFTDWDTLSEGQDPTDSRGRSTSD